MSYPSVTMDKLTELRHKRFHQSLNENPYFFVAPFSGVFVVSAAYTFIYRFMANHTSEHPEGHLGPEVLKSFFSVTEDAYGNFKYEYGHERIPDNWYRRAVGDEYNIPFFLGDLEAAARKHPEFLSIGGNTGKVNSFVGVDPTNPSGSVFNAKNLAEGNNFFCYFFSLMQASPNANEYLQIHPIESATEHFSQFSSFASRFNCPQRERLDPDAFDKYPGFTRIGFPDPGVVVKYMEKFNCSTRPMEDKAKDKKRNDGKYS
ncbi:uncharacterized protein [Bemisia tabaci]|uniref:uncharacterized protein n=1 Tax=Bemisia tabaci TaxID=7038 RepID=UPI003B27CB3F